MKKLGTKIEKVAQPVAKAVDYWVGTNLQHCGGCKQMVSNLDGGMSLGNAIYDRFFREHKPKEK